MRCSTADDRALVRASSINKFRGDSGLFDDGIAPIDAEDRLGAASGRAVWSRRAQRLPAEDALDLASSSAKPGAPSRSPCPILPRIANFDDLDPLQLEPGVALAWSPPGQPLPGDADLVILPGSKATIADLAFLRAQGWDIDLCAHRRRGGHVLGLCGGYQMLGRSIADPDGIEGRRGTVDGPRPARRRHGADRRQDGARRHGAIARRGAVCFAPTRSISGAPTGPTRARAVPRSTDEPEGRASPDGRVIGTYLHGLFRRTPSAPPTCARSPRGAPSACPTSGRSRRPSTASPTISRRISTRADPRHRPAGG